MTRLPIHGGIAPLRDLVDEIWVPSRFVRDTSPWA
jgi:hypothetical protein